MSDSRDPNPESLADAEPADPARQNIVAGQPTSEPAADEQQSTAASEPSDPLSRGRPTKPTDGDETIKNTIPNIR